MDPSPLEGCDRDLSLCYSQDTNVKRILDNITPLADNLLFAREKVLFWIFQVCDTLDVSVRSIEMFVFVFDTYWQHNQAIIRRQDIQMLAVSTLAFVIKELEKAILPLDRMMFLCRNSHPESSFTKQIAELTTTYSKIHSIVSPSHLLRRLDPEFDFEDFKVAIIFFYQMNDKGTIMEAIDILFITMRFIRTSPLMIDINGENIDRLTAQIEPFLHKSKEDLEIIVTNINDFVCKNDFDHLQADNSNGSQIDIEENGELSAFCSEIDNEELSGIELQQEQQGQERHENKEQQPEELNSPFISLFHNVNKLLIPLPKQEKQTFCNKQTGYEINNNDDEICEEKDDQIQNSIGFESGVFLSSPNLLFEPDFQKTDNSYATTITALHSNYSSLSTVTTSQGIEIRPQSKSAFSVFPTDQFNSPGSSFQFAEYPTFSPPVKPRQQTKNNLIEVFPSTDCITFQQLPTAFTLDDEIV